MQKLPLPLSPVQQQAIDDIMSFTHRTPVLVIEEPDATLNPMSAPRAVQTRSLKLPASEVQAIIEGRKTQLREPLNMDVPANFMQGDVASIINRDKSLWALSNSGWGSGKKGAWPADPKPGFPCPLGMEGDRLLIEADGNPAKTVLVHLKRTELERVHGIFEDEAEAEAFPFAGVRHSCHDIGPHRKAFEAAWRQKYAGTANDWDVNPWVWVGKFEVVKEEGAAA